MKNKGGGKSVRIIKKQLEGPDDGLNEHWSVLRVNMLKELYEAEKDTPIIVSLPEECRKNVELLNILSNEKSPIEVSSTIGRLIDALIEKKIIDEDERYNTSSCIIERIILRCYKLGNSPPFLYLRQDLKKLDPTVFFVTTRPLPS